MKAPFETAVAGAGTRVPAVQDGATLGGALDWQVIHKVLHITTLHLLAVPTLEFHGDHFRTQPHTVFTTGVAASVPTF